MLEVQKKKEAKRPKVVKTKSGKIMLLAKCALYNGKKSKFNKEQELDDC